jgi:hypothetical protein
MALPKAKEIVSSNPVVVFRFVFVYQTVSFFDLMISYTFMDVDFAVCNHSKTYCPFCVNVKQLLTQLGANFKAIELDTESERFLFSLLFLNLSSKRQREFLILTAIDYGIKSNPLCRRIGFIIALHIFPSNTLS